MRVRRRSGLLGLSRPKVAGGLVLALVAGGTLYAATQSPGYVRQDVEPNDGAVWVTNDRIGLLGRLNKPAGALDVALATDAAAATHQLETIQSGTTVLARDRVTSRLIPVDVRLGTLREEKSVAVSAGTLVAAGGSTVATVDPANGAIRVAEAGADRVAVVGDLAPDGKPIGSVRLAQDAAPGRGAGLAVGGDGTAYVVGSRGDLATLTPTGAGRYSIAAGSVGAALRSVDVAVIAGRPVVLDAVAGVLAQPDHEPLTVGDQVVDGVLGGAGSADETALVATPSGLVSVDLDTGETRPLYAGGTGKPAAPVVVGECRYAAWAGTPGLAVRQCGSAPAEPVTLAGDATLLAPTIRLNRGAAVLNDGATGSVWDLDTGARIDNWDAVAPESAPTPKKKVTEPSVTTSTQPPKAVDDELWARPGRTSVLHVLDNDANPAGSILMIRRVTQPASGKVSVAPDGQTLQASLTPGVATLTFTYAIDDGKGHESLATVTLRTRGPKDNGEPFLRTGFKPTGFAVGAQGRLSVPVIGDWRDPDSDPVVLTGAVDGRTEVPVSPDGRIQYLAPDEAGPRTLTYTVSDGTLRATAPLAVQVLAADSTAASAPIPQPDVARGEVGQPIVIHPLDNDLPGADPSTPDARLEVAGQVAAPTGVTADTNLRAGTVTVTAGSEGTYLLTYTAAYGSAPYARSTIRVDVAPPRSSRAAPTAMLDQAVVHDTVPTLVDVLANDHDPTGRLLAVQSATAEDPTMFEVAVIRGRWVRVAPLRSDISPNPGRIRYVVTNGVTPSATGEVSVQQLPTPAQDVPTPLDDDATVRAGDNTVIPVVDNDTHPSGASLSLVARPDPALPSGVLGVLPGLGSKQPAKGAEAAALGTAYVSGNVVRFQAPTVTAPTTVRIPYVVEDPMGNRAAATAYVTVTPPPSDDRPNQPPTPASIEGRVVAGDTMVIQVPTSGSDPDGDSVTLQGISAAPRHGRILAMSPSSVTYQAYPTSAETDTIGIQVIDRYGAVGQGSVRIAVLPPGDPQPVVPTDDLVTAAPGSTIVLEPLANDIVAIGDRAQLLPLAESNPGMDPALATADPDKGTVTLTAPDSGTATVRYAVRGAAGLDAAASVRVRTQEGYNIPPVARNAYATPRGGATDVSVDVLQSAVDPDGGDEPLTVTQVFATEGAQINGGQVTVPVLTRPQVVGYEIEDSRGARAMATIFVPPVGAGVPAITANALIRVPKDGSTTFALKDVVVNPNGTPVILTTTDQLAASPVAGLRVAADTETTLTVSATGGYVGPASVTFEVTDGSGVSDPAGHRALLTVPVQVGPETPVLRCPPTQIAVVQGGRSRPISIAELCHVWTARPEQAAQLEYVGRFPDQPRGLSVTNAGPHTLVVAAGGDAAPGTTSRLLVSVPGTDAAPAELSVLVASTAAPTVAPIILDGVKAGTTRTVNVGGYITSQLGEPAKRVVETTRLSGSAAQLTQDGPTTLSVTPSPDAKGSIVFRLVVSDFADAGYAGRLGQGTLTVNVLGVPDAPGAPRLVGPVESHAALLGWAVPANNGMPIEKYTVTWSGGQQECGAPPCQITNLDNVPHVFTVVAHNAVGDSRPSAPSKPIMPDEVPGAPTNLATSDPGDGTLTVSWTPPVADGSPITTYLVTWPGGRAESTGASVVATGLDNLIVTEFNVKASNRAGWGPASTVRGQSAGRPDAPRAPTLGAEQVAGGDRQALTVSWDAVSPNGPGPTTYTVTRSGPGGALVICENTTQTTCTAPPVDNDGSSYDYAVTAANPFLSSPAGAASTHLAIGPPGEFSRLSAEATGVSEQVQLSFTSPPARDSSLTITCTLAGGGGCGSWTAGEDPEAFTALVTAPNGDPAQFTLTATNRSSSSSSTVTSDVVYGPVGTPTVAGLHDEGPYVAFSATVDPRGRPADVVVEVEAGGSRIARFTETTGNGPWEKAYLVKVGFDQDVTVTVTAVRSGDRPPAGTATTRTRNGSISVTGAPASTCVAGTPCTDVAMTVSIDNFGPSRAVRCTIAEDGGGPRPEASLTLNTGGGGSATGAVPESTYLATSGAAYTVTCDDSDNPASPATTTWSAP